MKLPCKRTHPYPTTTQGTIPTQLGNLVKMTSILGLYLNKLTGTIPTQIGRLVDLNVYFGVYDNELTGSVPTELGNLEVQQIHE